MKIIYTIALALVFNIANAAPTIQEQGTIEGILNWESTCQIGVPIDEAKLIVFFDPEPEAFANAVASGECVIHVNPLADINVVNNGEWDMGHQSTWNIMAAIEDWNNFTNTELVVLWEQGTEFYGNQYLNLVDALEQSNKSKAKLKRDAKDLKAEIIELKHSNQRLAVELKAASRDNAKITRELDRARNDLLECESYLQY